MPHRCYRYAPRPSSMVRIINGPAHVDDRDVFVCATMPHSKPMWVQASKAAAIHRENGVIGLIVQPLTVTDPAKRPEKRIFQTPRRVSRDHETANKTQCRVKTI
jgi:hypothetical protein